MAEYKARIELFGSFHNIAFEAGEDSASILAAVREATGSHLMAGNIVRLWRRAGDGHFVSVDFL